MSDNTNQSNDRAQLEADARDELGGDFVSRAKEKANQYEEDLLHRLIALKRDLDDSSLSQDEVNDELEHVLSEDPANNTGEDELI